MAKQHSVEIVRKLQDVIIYQACMLQLMRMWVAFPGCAKELALFYQQRAVALAMMGQPLAALQDNVQAVQV